MRLFVAGAGSEADAPDPAAPGARRAGGEGSALALVGRGVSASVVRLAPSVHDRVKRGFVAEVIAAKRGLPLRPVPPGQAQAYFGGFAALAGTDAPASSSATRSRLGWEPSHPGLLTDLAHGDFFPSARRAPAPQGGER